MSYEYRLVFNDSSLLQFVMASLQSSDSCAKVEGRSIYLKDRLLKSVAEYDAKLTFEGDFSVWLEVNCRSIRLYELVKKSLNGGILKCYEDGDLNDELSLRGVFRIKDCE